jgi:DHA1 family bicyclomycin/chloramphenicol resistance-like MFS transporter
MFALSFAVMMAYISSSPFVYQNVVGLSEVGFGLAFGVNAVGLTAAGWIASRLVEHTSPLALVRAAFGLQLAAALVFVCLAAVDAAPWTYPIPVFVAVAANGAIMGNAAALAMAQVRDVAGAGSAVLGFTQFGLGALVSPLVGLGGDHSALVPAAVMAVAAGLGFAISRLTGPGAPDQSAPVSWSSTETATS